MNFQKLMKQVDKQNMIKLLKQFPTQFKEAYEFGKKWPIPQSFKKKKFDHVCIQGMGGSGIGGEIIKNLMHKNSKILVKVNQSYSIPTTVTKNTLFFAVSYSGNTEETISGFKQAKKKKASIIAITSGGKLAKKSKYVLKVSGGFPPRTQLAFSFVPMMAIMQRLNLTKKNKELENTYRFLNKYNKELEKQGKNLALQIKNKTPIIYGQYLFKSVLIRFHTQLAENSKAFSHWNIFPELTHNELVGYKNSGKLVFVFFRDAKESVKIKKRINVAKNIIKKHSKVIEIKVKGKTLMEKLFYASLLGDYCSYYLALLYKVNPSPVKNIEILKKKLKH